MHFIDRQLLYNEELKWRKKGCDLAMAVGNSIFLLFSRDFAPLPDRVESIILRLKAVPMFLHGSKSMFQRVPELWGEIYLDSAQNLSVFLDSIERSLAPKISSSLHLSLKNAIVGAKQAIAQFVSWLKQAIMPNALDNWALGAESFQALIAAKQYKLNSDELLSIAHERLALAESSIDSLSGLILGSGFNGGAEARRAAQARLNELAPQGFEQALNAFKEAFNRARAFVETSGFATLVDNESLEVVETPDFMRHLIPFSAYIAPEKRAKHCKGAYLITRPASKASSRYNFADIVNTAIHEGYPGHHLQLSGQNSHSGILRHLCENVELIEGWAGYCQSRVREMGFETGKESLYALAQEEIFNASRAIADINSQTGKWSFDVSVNYLTETNRIDRSTAASEVKRMSQNPGGHAACVFGRYFLDNLKSKLKASFKGDFTDRRFHDLVIFQGSLPAYTAAKFYPKLLKAQLKSSSRQSYDI